MKTFNILTLSFLILILTWSQTAKAQLQLPPLSTRVAQEGSDAYDPFADYSEFEEATEEESDINFFRNGRFFTIALLAGYRPFTGTLADIYKPGALIGGQISYFFDLRFAIQIAYMTSDHTYSYPGYTGTVTLSNTSFDIKYYFNTQNVTRGLAKLNPYAIVGVSQVYRTQRIDGTQGFNRDSAMGVDAGVGIEIPMMRNKMYFGAEATYQYVNFPDENNEVLLETSPGTFTRTGVYPKGDAARFMGMLGVNF